MANTPDLLQYLRSAISINPDEGPVNLKAIRNFVSSPRLFDLNIKGPASELMVPAGDTFLDMHTMLADKAQKTYAISLTDWEKTKSQYEPVQAFRPRDQTVIQVQVWPFCPDSLDHFQMTVAVALGYTRAELDAESRISSALDELSRRFGFYTDEF